MTLYFSPGGVEASRADRREPPIAVRFICAVVDEAQIVIHSMCLSNAICCTVGTPAEVVALQTFEQFIDRLAVQRPPAHMAPGYTIGVRYGSPQAVTWNITKYTGGNGVARADADRRSVAAPIIALQHESTVAVQPHRVADELPLV